MRRLALALAMMLAWPFGAAAQDSQTLADIKAELILLMAEFNALKGELVASGTASGAGGGDALQRMDAIEAELMRLTAKAEEIDLNLNRVIADGTNRIGDLEFRLCEATPGCDIATLPEIAVLGGGAASAAPATPTAPADPATPTPGPELAISEQADFDRAQEVLGQGDFPAAAALFAAFAQSYPGGPLTQEAQYQAGEALAMSGDVAGSARAYLEAFSGAPDGTRAPDALLKLGLSLGALGQNTEACVTLAEVSNRYPGTPAEAEALSARGQLACP